MKWLIHPIRLFCFVMINIFAPPFMWQTKCQWHQHQMRKCNMVAHCTCANDFESFAMSRVAIFNADVCRHNSHRMHPNAYVLAVIVQIFEEQIKEKTHCCTPQLRLSQMKWSPNKKNYDYSRSFSGIQMEFVRLSPKKIRSTDNVTVLKMISLIITT